VTVPEGTHPDRKLLALLAPATFFEGYDTLLLGLALPLIRREFGLTLAAAGVMGSIIFGGSFGSLALLALADRYGRRRMLTVTIAGYTLGTGLTALSTGAAAFTVAQLLARVFLGAEKPLASIVVVEAVAEERRGRGLAVLSSMVALGQAAAGLGFLLVVLTGASWRLLYAAGVLPLLLVAVARRALPETLHPGATVRFGFSAIRALRARWVLGATTLAFLFSIYPTGVTVFASTLVLDEWHWRPAGINPVFFAVWAAAVSGFFVAGRIMDRWGRRPTALLFLVGATLAGFVAFTAGGDAARGLGLGAVIFFLTGSAPVVAAFTTEPFPEAVRGRIGAVTRVADIAGSTGAPALVGALAGGIGGVGPAIAVAGTSYALGAVTVATMLPETRGLAVG